MSEDYFLYYNCLSYLNFLIFKLTTSFNYFITLFFLKFESRKECEELEADERNIDSKIKKKQEELDRTEKRLKSLENVRPQFMDEVCTRSKCRVTLYEIVEGIICYDLIIMIIGSP